jgi:hypothetical protein
MTAAAAPFLDERAPTLDRLIDDALDRSGADAREIAAPFLPLLARPERGVRAVLLYGSCLWSELRRPTSHPDFFLIVDSLRAWHGRRWPALLDSLLPPGTYRLRAGALPAKVSITSAAQLARLCSPAAPDLHHLGRLSKRVALVWARDAQSRQLVVDAQTAALRTLAPLARTVLGERFSVDEFMLALLDLSYEGEVRIAERGKVAALFHAEREHYRAVGRALLADAPAPFDRARRAAWLRRSRRRALLRWPKYIWSYDGWLDYVLEKLARTGERFQISARERRYWFVLGFGVLWRLARAGRLTGAGRSA